MSDLQADLDRCLQDSLEREKRNRELEHAWRDVIDALMKLVRANQ